MSTDSHPNSLPAATIGGVTYNIFNLQLSLTSCGGQGWPIALPSIFAQLLRSGKQLQLLSCSCQEKETRTLLLPIMLSFLMFAISRARARSAVSRSS
eukprot:763492-Hanusia_phi.AAC.2